jgi:class 3 adenylate cyclase
VANYTLIMTMVDKWGCRALLCKIFERIEAIGYNVLGQLEVESLPFKESAPPHSEHLRRYFGELKNLYLVKHSFPLPAHPDEELRRVVDSMKDLFRRLQVVWATIDDAPNQSSPVAERALKVAIASLGQISQDAGELLERAVNLLPEAGAVLPSRATTMVPGGAATVFPSGAAPTIPSGAATVLSAKIVVHEPEKKKKVVVSVDLSQYGRLSDAAEGIAGVRSLFELNQMILDLITNAIKEACSIPNEVIVIETGDGALLLFDHAEEAVTFAEKLHQQADRQNRIVPNSDHKKHFRIGVSSGELMIEAFGTEDRTFEKYHLAGVCIAKAVRLQAGAHTGEILIDDATYRRLGNNDILGKAFSGPQDVTAKSHEAKIPAYVYPVVAPAAWDTGGASARSAAPVDSSRPTPVPPPPVPPP